MSIQKRRDCGDETGSPKESQSSSSSDVVTLVIRGGMGMRLEHARPYLKAGMPLAIGRAGAVISSVVDGDRIDETEHLATANAAMCVQLRRINTKVGGLFSVLKHGMEPSEQMWAEAEQALDALWPATDREVGQ